MAWTDDLHAQKKPFPVSEVDQNDNALVAAQDGVDATGVSAPVGGVGIRGWLSGIFQAITGTLKTNSAVSGATTTTLLNAVTSVGNGTGHANTLVNKVFTASITGTGSISASVRFSGSMDGTNYDTANPLATVVLSGTNADFGTYVHSGPYLYIRADVTAINGTSAAVTATVGG